MLPAPLYLSPTTIVHADVAYFGYMQGPRTGVYTAIKDGAWFALDNDCFNGGLDEEAWCEALFAYWPYRARCLFVAIPDVVGDAQATLKQFPRYAPQVRSMGYRVALVTQDGLIPTQVPWPQIDALFVGGSDNHKMGREAGLLIHAAKQRDKWVHVGRVNSFSRLMHFWRADSWDGTDMARGPQRHAKYERAVKLVRAMQANPYPLFKEQVA